MKSGRSTPEQLIAERIREMFESEQKMDNRILELVQHIQVNQPQKNLPPAQKAQFEKMIEPYREYAEFLKQSNFNKELKEDDSLAFNLFKFQAALSSDSFEGKRYFYRKAFISFDENTNFLTSELHKFKEKDPVLKSFLDGFIIQEKSSSADGSLTTAASLLMEPVQRGPRHELYLNEIMSGIGGLQNKAQVLEEFRKLQNPKRLEEEKKNDLDIEPVDPLARLKALQKEIGNQIKSTNKEINDKLFLAIIGPLTKELSRKRDELEKESQSLHSKASSSYSGATNYKKKQLDDLIAGVKLAGMDVNIARQYLELAKNDERLISSRGFSKSGIEKIINEGIKQIDTTFRDVKAGLLKDPSSTSLSEYHEKQKESVSGLSRQSMQGRDKQKKQEESVSELSKKSIQDSDKQSEIPTVKMDSKHLLDTQLPSHKEAFQKAKADGMLKAEIEARVPPPPTISPEEEHRQLLEKQKESLTSDFMQSINAVSKAAKEVSKAEKAIRMEDRDQAKQDIEKSKRDIESQFRAEVEAKVKMADAAALKESQALDREIQARAEAHARKLSESDHQMNVSRKEEMRERVQGGRAGKDDIPPPPPLDDSVPPPPELLAEWDEDFPPPPIPENYVPPPAISPEEEAIMLRREALVGELDDARARLANAMAERHTLQERLVNVSNELEGKVVSPVSNKVEVQHEEKLVQDTVHEEVQDYPLPVYHEEVEAVMETEKGYDVGMDDILENVGLGEGIYIEADHVEVPVAEAKRQNLIDEIEPESELDMMYQEQQQISVHR